MPSDLPGAAEGFVGRERELDEIINLWSSARLMTLIGAGGIGKTRLASEAVRRYYRATRTPVCWVRLARLAEGSDLTALTDEVARSVLDTDFSSLTAFDALVNTLTRTDATARSLPVVLVMDNCEHVLSAAGELISKLLDAVPGLTILATSRHVIGWSDERVIRVPPLTNDQSLTLFRRRAELSGYAIDGTDQIEMAAQICRHVHNCPLYIQLAVGRLLRRPLSTVLSELSGHADDKRLGWSTGPRVGVDMRHHTIGDVIGWSYNLCRPRERLLLDRMSVFAAGYDSVTEDSEIVGATALDVGVDLEAIQTICGDDTTSRDRDTADYLGAEDIEGLLETLVDQSLVTVHRTSATVRFSLLESIRVFARERLLECSTPETDEVARLTERHCQYYCDKIVQMQSDRGSPSEQSVLNWARAEWDNILTAIETSVATPDRAILGLQICVALICWRVPFFRGSLREMRCRTEHTLAATRTAEPGDLQVYAMALVVWLALCQGSHEDAERMLEQCVAACLTDAAAQSWRENPEIDYGMPAPVEFAWGAELMFIRRDARAITVLARARQKFHVLQDLSAEATSELYEALAAALFGTSDQAEQAARHHLERATASGSLSAKSWAELAWAITLTKRGDPEQALTVERTALTNLVDIGDRRAFCAVEIRMWSLARIIENDLAGEDPDDDRLTKFAVEIAQLSGGVRTLRAGLGLSGENMAPLVQEKAAAIAVARKVLGDDAFNNAEARGLRLRPELNEVEKLALGALAMPEETPAPPYAPYDDDRRPWEKLSKTEREIAVLAAAGWPNTAIAARRGTSFRTVDAQIHTIFQKFGIDTRTDIIRFAPMTELDRIRAEAARRPRRAGEPPKQSVR